MAAVDCTVRKTVCDLYNIIAYPTIKYFSYSKNERKYKLGRTVKRIEDSSLSSHQSYLILFTVISTLQASELISYLMDPDNAPTKKSEPYGEYPGSEDILMLHEDTFEDALAQNNNLLVLFYAPGTDTLIFLSSAFQPFGLFELLIHFPSAIFIGFPFHGLPIIFL